MIDVALRKHGGDKIGHSYLLEACRIGRDLGIFDGHTPLRNQGGPDYYGEEWNKELTKVLAVTAWALFNFQMSVVLFCQAMHCSYTHDRQVSSVHSSSVIIKTPPAIPIPYHDQEEKEGGYHSFSVLARFDAENSTLPIGMYQVHHHARLPRRADRDWRRKGDRAAQLGSHRVLLQSTDRLVALPRCIYSPRVRTVEGESSMWVSHDRSAHGELIFLEFLLKRRRTPCSMMYQIDVINLHRPILYNKPRKNWSDGQLNRARSIISSSLKTLRRYLVFHEQRHGWDSAITFVLYPITVASFGSLEEMAASEEVGAAWGEGSEPYLGLLTCLRALEQMSSYSYFAQPLLRLLVQRCQSIGLPVPTEIQRRLEGYTNEEWSKEASLLVGNQYVAEMRRAAWEAESARMEAIILSWEGVLREGTGKGKGRDG